VTFLETEYRGTQQYVFVARGREPGLPAPAEHDNKPALADTGVVQLVVFEPEFLRRVVRGVRIGEILEREPRLVQVSARVELVYPHYLRVGWWVDRVRVVELARLALPAVLLVQSCVERSRRYQAVTTTKLGYGLALGFGL
jgi:hypothetical protein